MIPKKTTMVNLGYFRIRSRFEQKLFVKKTEQKDGCHFLGSTGHVSTVALEDKRNVNSEWYTTVCLPWIFQHVREKRPKGRIISQQDNARAHLAA